MTMKLSLSPDLEKRLRTIASKEGKPVELYAAQLLETNLSAAEKRALAREMLKSWIREDEALTDEESAENEKILRAIDEDRLSDRKLFTNIFGGDSQ